MNAPRIVNHTSMFEREKVFAFDVAGAIEACLGRIDGDLPKALRVTEIASQLATMKFIGKDGMVDVPTDIKGMVADKYLAMLDPNSPTSGTLLPYGYDLYAEKNGKVVVPVAEDFFGILNGDEVLDCLGALSEREAIQALPRRNNPTVGIVVFNNEQSVNMLVAAWYQRQVQTFAGQRQALKDMRAALPRLQQAVQKGTLPAVRPMRDILDDE